MVTRIGRHGLAGIESCLCPTSDGGKPCDDGTDCQGMCQCEEVGDAQGECSPWVVVFGCQCVMMDGQTAMLCVD